MKSLPYTLNARVVSKDPLVNHVLGQKDDDDIESDVYEASQHERP